MRDIDDKHSILKVCYSNPSLAARFSTPQLVQKKERKKEKTMDADCGDYVVYTERRFNYTRPILLK